MKTQRKDNKRSTYIYMHLNFLSSLLYYLEFEKSIEQENTLLSSMNSKISCSCIWRSCRYCPKSSTLIFLRQELKRRKMTLNACKIFLKAALCRCPISSSSNLNNSMTWSLFSKELNFLPILALFVEPLHKVKIVM